MEGYVLLLPNAHRDEGLTATRKLAGHLRENGHEVMIRPFLSDGLPEACYPDVSALTVEEAISGAKLVVTLGGDGTILQISRYLAGTGVPIVGVNMGNKGFLTELEDSQLLRVLDVAEGRYTVQSRMMLDVELWRGGEPVYRTLALNEAVVRALVSLIRLEAYGEDREITSYSGDGIIVATPTGSTAYSMAAGGPLVEPEGDCIILSPICTFRLAARSVVLTPNRHVRVRVPEQGGKEVMLSVDGESVHFLDGDELRVKRSDKTLLMARLGERSFYDIVFEKLNDKN
ncbi:MAG: NAD(+)/NADH kinase [Oscillospiraceae bacterium]|nr:NAD(+)/NADH kinase [Oscillospiraceae bacterium]